MMSRLTYIVSHEATYASVIEGQEINVSRQALNSEGGDDGVHWEFMIRWHNLGDRSAPRVEMFDDSWQAFLDAPALFAALAERADYYSLEPGSSGMTPADCAVMLDELGFVDRTDR